MTRIQLACHQILESDVSDPATSHRAGVCIYWRELDGPGDDIYYSYVSEEEYEAADYTLDRLVGVLIPREYYQPRVKSSWTRFEQPLQPKYFLKRCFPGAYDPHSPTNEWPSTEFQEEIDILEKVRQHPHFNIVHYHGIKVEGDIVTALVLGKLEIDLTEAQLSPTQTRHLYDPDLLIDDIRRGMEHLHSIGIMHGDIQPGNICLDDQGRGVIIDFDSAFVMGRKRYGKIMQPYWVDIEVQAQKDGLPKHGHLVDACPEIDYECFRRTVAWIRENPQVPLSSSDP